VIAASFIRETKENDETDPAQLFGGSPWRAIPSDVEIVMIMKKTHVNSTSAFRTSFLRDGDCISHSEQQMARVERFLSVKVKAARFASPHKNV
jgi:hypothetical protein